MKTKLLLAICLLFGFRSMAQTVLSYTVQSIPNTYTVSTSTLTTNHYNLTTSVTDETINGCDGSATIIIRNENLNHQNYLNIDNGSANIGNITDTIFTVNNICAGIHTYTLYLYPANDTVLTSFNIKSYSTTTVTPTPLPSIGLVAYYPFLGNAIDSSGNGNNGTINGATLVSDRFGNANSAYSFNGTTNNINIADNSTLQFNSNLQTISFWMKIPQIPTPQYIEPIIEKYDQHLAIDGNGNAGQGYMVQFDATGGLHYSFKNGVGHNWGDCVIPSSKFSANQYYNIVFTNDNDSLRGYVNCVKVTSSKIPTGTVIGSNTLSLLIGKSRQTNAGNNVSSFKGQLDDIRIYDVAIIVNPLPTVSINSIPNFVNINASSITLTGSPAGGTYMGIGVSSNSFNPINAGLGTKQITYNYTNNNGCSNSSTVSTIVYDTTGKVCSAIDTLIIHAVLTGVNTPNNVNTIKIFPNPTNNKITIDFGNYSLMNGYSIKISNTLGQTVFSSDVNQQQTSIDLSTLTGKGIYFVAIIDAGGNTIDNKRIVLQ